MTPLFVWLWEATGDPGFACGVCDDQAGAQEAAGACMASGKATTAVVQLAKLVDDPDTLEPHYVRFGSRWQASLTRSGKIRWRESAGPQAKPPEPAPGKPKDRVNPSPMHSS